LAYNTNGLAHHDLLEAIRLLADIGYQGVAITLDHRALNPYDDRTPAQIEQVALALEARNLRCVIETGARFLLDPRIKHEPTLVTADAAARARRIDFLCRAIDVAARLKAKCVSLWSGVVHDGAGEREAFSRLVAGLTEVLQYAEERNVVLAFEPEPGMLIDTLGRYSDMVDELTTDRVDVTQLQLTIDIGHLHCQGEVPIDGQIRRWRDRLANVHIEDMQAGIHEHLMFGDGEIDFPPVIATLAEIGYSGLLGVELSRHSHEGPVAARRAYNSLRPLIEKVSGDRCQVSGNPTSDPDT
ncbi:MAG TPA: sugar phosphate isomerase/epimerase family protein, partial [Lacipirellulaceae bacterium]|nr:sugar phosphate isomerase/epimerase family protein [Lacipirellulaceae bacterium]